jgi:hypothetical protein
MIDASVFEFHPAEASALDVSTVDADLTTLWPGGNGNTYKQAYARRIYVGQTGDVKVDLLGSTGVVFAGAPVGSTLHGIFTKVYHTGTTAAKLVVLK